MEQPDYLTYWWKFSISRFPFICTVNLSSFWIRLFTEQYNCNHCLIYCHLFDNICLHALMVNVKFSIQTCTITANFGLVSFAWNYDRLQVCNWLCTRCFWEIVYEDCILFTHTTVSDNIHYSRISKQANPTSHCIFSNAHWTDISFGSVFCAVHRNLFWNIDEYCQRSSAYIVILCHFGSCVCMQCFTSYCNDIQQLVQRWIKKINQRAKTK